MPTQPDSSLIDRAEAVLGYRFKDEKLLCEALTHASCADSRLTSNERMEFLGDAVLGQVVCEMLFRNFPDLREGDMTKIKSLVVSRKTCAMISRKIGLCSLLSLGKGMERRQGVPGSVSAAVLEAIIAALYLDGGDQVARRFIQEHLEQRIQDAASSAHQQNFKSVLQQHAQRYLTGSPQYMLLDEQGPDHAKCFEVCVEIAGRQFDPAWANAKKEAEQKAALNALIELGLVEIGDDQIVRMIETEAVAD